MNRLKVNQQETIVTLWRRGWSLRRIAREVGYDRDTVSKYIRLERAKSATPSPGSATGSEPVAGRELPGDDAIPPTLTAGSGGDDESKPATPSPGSEPENGVPATPGAPGPESKPATLTAGSAGVVEPEPATPTPGKSEAADPNGAGTPGDGSELFTQALAAAQANVSLCEPLEDGDRGRPRPGLVGEANPPGPGPRSRFCGSLPVGEALRSPAGDRRPRCRSGGWSLLRASRCRWILGPARGSSMKTGKRRRSHVFRAVLCCSRKGYSEATFDQKTETFLRCLENAFRHFGGVPDRHGPGQSEGGGAASGLVRSGAQPEAGVVCGSTTAR